MSQEHKPSRSFEVEMKVPFYDVDPMQIVWHGNYLKYFDVARTALFDHFGLDLFNFYNPIRYVFPIIKTTTKYIQPLRHRDAFICKATIVEAKIKIVVDFEIRLLPERKLCTRGRTEQAAIKLPDMEMVYRIPEEIHKILECSL